MGLLGYMSLCVRLDRCFDMVFAYLKSNHPFYYEEFKHSYTADLLLRYCMGY